MSKHVYKQVAKQEPEPVSFVAAVKQYGDAWRVAIPGHVNVYHDFNGDKQDSTLMSLMEKGILPRTKEVVA